MPDLRWNKLELIECFGVLPETDEYETYVGYSVVRQGLALLVTVRPLEGVVDVSLQRDGNSEDIIGFALRVHGVIELKREKWGDFLRMTDCRVVVDRFYYMREQDADATREGPPVEVEIIVDPDIRILFR